MESVDIAFDQTPTHFMSADVYVMLSAGNGRNWHQINNKATNSFINAEYGKNGLSCTKLLLDTQTVLMKVWFYTLF